MRIWIVIAVLLFGASYFTVRFSDPSLWLISAISVTLFALPSVIAYLRHHPQAWRVFLAISMVAYIIETIGLLTGFPYTPFTYGELMAPKIAGITPLMLPVAFVPLVVGALYYAKKMRERWQQLLVGVGVLVVADLVLDPAAVALELWSWDIVGWYYGVPALNFAGWVLTGSLVVLIGLSLPGKLPMQSMISLYLIMSFWSGVCLWLGLWIPFIVGVVSVGVMSYQLWRTDTSKLMNESMP